MPLRGAESAVGARSARVHAVAFLHALCVGLPACLGIAPTGGPAAGPRLLLQEITVSRARFFRPGGFGRRLRTGSSSLAYLKRLPVSEIIKVDRSFVLNMDNDEGDT